MKKIVKPLFFTAFAFVFTASSFAQSTGKLATDLRRIIRDYPNQFNSLKGSLLEENPQSAEYACNCPLDGSISTSITKYSSGEKPVHSWQAVMLETEDFNEAAKKFKSLFNAINKLDVKMEYGETFHLSGKYDVPEESRKFATTVFSFDKSDLLTSRMRLEISLQYEMLEWKIRLLIYDKDREDDERGKVIE